MLLKPLVWSIADVTVHGTENVENFSGAYIAVANHSSHLDTPLVMGSLPKRLSRYLAAGAAADYFFKNWWKAAPTALFFNAFPVYRERAETGSQRRGLAGQLLSEGVPLLIYPEGTRSRTGQMARFKPGAAALSISRNVPIIPVALVGALEAMPHGNGWVRRGRPPIHVVIGSPMYARTGESAAVFAERVAKVIRDMHDQTATTVGLPRLIEYAAAAEESRRGDRARRRPSPSLGEPPASPDADTVQPDPSERPTPPPLRTDDDEVPEEVDVADPTEDAASDISDADDTSDASADGAGSTTETAPAAGTNGASTDPEPSSRRLRSRTRRAVPAREKEMK